MRIPRSLIALIVLLCTLFLSSCDRQPKKKPVPPPPKVIVAQPTVQDITNYIYFTGYTEARRSVELRARVEGFLQSVSFTPGASVKKGDLLFSIDPKQYEEVVSQKKAELAINQAKMKLAKASLQRKESAFKEHAVSELAVLEARAQVSEAQGEVEAAEAALSNSRLNLSYTKVNAPMDGIISRNLVDEGNLVGSGGEKTLLATLINSDPTYVYFTVDEHSLMLYKKNNRKRDSDAAAEQPPVAMALEGDDGYPYTGKTDYMDARMDRATGTIQARAVFDNKDFYIQPGLYAKIRMPYKHVKDALLVPDEAIGSDQRGKYLLTVGSDNMVAAKPVTTGALVNGLRVIKKGVTATDMVVIEGIQRAQPGSPVTPLTKDQSTAHKSQ